MRLAILIGSLALAAIVTVFAFTAPASAAGFYVSTSFGPNWDSDSPLPFVNEKTGLAGTLAVGTVVGGVPDLRVEIEASFRTHETTIGPFTLEHDTTAFMANAIYDANGLAMGRIVPYILVGAGVAHTELTFGGLAPLTVENDGFAWNAGVGLNYQISENVKAGIGYRYLEAPAVELFGFELDGGSNQAVTANVTIAFN